MLSMSNSARTLSVSLRIAIVQLNPQIGQVKQNIERAWELVHKLKDSISKERAPDLVLFPELALTGYNFLSREHILPYTSAKNDGPSIDLAKEVSRLFKCYTVIGYPERVDQGPEPILYNSAAVTDPTGKQIFNYRKSFLYYTDDDWGCQENPLGFQSFPLHFKNRARNVSEDSSELEDVTLRTSIGICMDLSPYKFEAPFYDFEFATYNVDQRNELIICPMAWLHSASVTKNSGPATAASVKLEAIQKAIKKEGIPACGSQGNYQLSFNNSDVTPRIARESVSPDDNYEELDKPDMSNVNYWILRFMPFLALRQRASWPARSLEPLVAGSRKRRSYMGASLTSQWEFRNRNAIVLMGNRCGIEDANTVYAGSSGIYKFNGKFADAATDIDSLNESVELLGNLGKGLEGVLLRDVTFEVTR
ncbi:hypothetical protein HG536_0G04530 [Torulaspora globosa]|uniref:CN hydrolase domain-containing protein n=1 Tax=Torulaspora globosa TaxID=48254 RepID=A0A7G3ZM55_9SACH|nr:uncharacterized protein HG536_0G04530 [Torulaspora globosa]QLL34591.1 hypothetical protein HG536_0G04530 [Torulaspora globosa]